MGLPEKNPGRCIRDSPPLLPPQPGGHQKLPDGALVLAPTRAQGFVMIPGKFAQPFGIAGGLEILFGVVEPDECVPAAVQDQGWHPDFRVFTHGVVVNLGQPAYRKPWEELLAKTRNARERALQDHSAQWRPPRQFAYDATPEGFAESNHIRR